MANVVITSDSTKILVDFGVFASATGFSKGAWSKKDIMNIALSANGDAIEVHTRSEQDWRVSWETNSVGALVVDSVDGVAPTSNSDLYDKLKALMV